MASVLSLEDYNTSPTTYATTTTSCGADRMKVAEGILKDTLPLLLNPSIVFLPSRYTDYSTGA